MTQTQTISVKHKHTTEQTVFRGQFIYTTIQTFGAFLIYKYFSSARIDQKR